MKVKAALEMHGRWTHDRHNILRDSALDAVVVLGDEVCRLRKIVNHFRLLRRERPAPLPKPAGEL